MSPKHALTTGKLMVIITRLLLEIPLLIHCSGLCSVHLTSHGLESSLRPNAIYTLSRKTFWYNLKTNLSPRNASCVKP